MCLAALVYVAILSPLMALEEHWSQELTRKRQLLRRYQTLTAGRARIAAGHQALKATLAQMEGQFLAGANPAMAAADLQEILKQLTGAHGVQLTSTKILAPREAGPYLEVPVQVQLSGTMDQLLTILYHLEHHKKVLYIPEMEINAPRWAAAGKPTGAMQVNLLVAGVMKKGTPS